MELTLEKAKSIFKVFFIGSFLYMSVFFVEIMFNIKLLENESLKAFYQLLLFPVLVVYSVSLITLFKLEFA